MENMKELDDVLKKINKQFGEGAIMTYDDDNLPKIERLSSGILPLDLILGGGYPVGRIIEIYGPESSGKTTIALKAIASAQKAGKTCAFIDAEHALDPQYAKVLGVKMNSLLISQPNNGEEALEIAEALVRSGAIGMIVVDSVAALTPRKEVDGEMGDANVGLHARLMSQAMRKLTPVLGASNCIAIFINQIREKVGVMYGNPETTTGGRALKFYASVRLDVRKKETLKNGTESVANRTKVKTVKNKTYPPFKQTEFDIVFGKGPDEVGSVIDFAIAQEIINKAGAWFTFKDRRFRGKSEVVEYFNTEGKAEFEKLKADIMASYYSKNSDEQDTEQEKASKLAEADDDDMQNLIMDADE